MYKSREDYLLNVDEVLGPKLKKKLPRFVVNFIKRRLHQDEINDCIMKAEHYHGAGFFDEALNYLNITYKVRWAENLDLSKKYVFACNHPLGGPEALIIGSIFQKIYGEGFKVISNQLLMNMKPLAEFFYPVKVQAKSQSRELSEHIANMFSSSSQVLIFPAGLCAKCLGRRCSFLKQRNIRRTSFQSIFPDTIHEDIIFSAGSADFSD